MAEIIKVFKDPIPALRFIGKKYFEVGHWGEWFANGWFEAVESSMGGVDSVLAIWENGGAYVGLERKKDGEPFEYWIGMFTPINTIVLDGFEYVDFAAGHLGTCWIYGKEAETHDTSKCKSELEKNGIAIMEDQNGAVWSFENCICPRYTTPDENGNVILDYCYFAK